MKSDVELMLPRKKEIIIYANMTEYQKSLHDHLINETLGKYLKEKLSVGRVVTKLNNLIIWLFNLGKSVTNNHPDLLDSAFDGSYFYPPVNEIAEQCGKFHLLDRLLKRLFARNHKVLIFSKWTKVLDIMDYYFEWLD